MRPDHSHFPGVIDAGDGELEITNEVIAPDGFPRRLICSVMVHLFFDIRLQCYLGWWYFSRSDHQSAQGSWFSSVFRVDLCLTYNTCDNRAEISR